MENKGQLSGGNKKIANEEISEKNSSRYKMFLQSGQRQACLPMCPRLSILRKSPRVNGLTGSKSTFKKDTKRQGIYPRANNFVENGKELLLNKQTKLSLKAFFPGKKKIASQFFVFWSFFPGTFTEVLLLIPSPRHVNASVQFHSIF